MACERHGSCVLRQTLQPIARPPSRAQPATPDYVRARRLIDRFTRMIGAEETRPEIRSEDHDAASRGNDRGDMTRPVANGSRALIAPLAPRHSTARVRPTTGRLRATLVGSVPASPCRRPSHPHHGLPQRPQPEDRRRRVRHLRLGRLVQQPTPAQHPWDDDARGARASPLRDARPRAGALMGAAENLGRSTLLQEIGCAPQGRSDAGRASMVDGRRRRPAHPRREEQDAGSPPPRSSPAFPTRAPPSTTTGPRQPQPSRVHILTAYWRRLPSSGLDRRIRPLTRLFRGLPALTFRQLRCQAGPHRIPGRAGMWMARLWSRGTLPACTARARPSYMP